MTTPKKLRISARQILADLRSGMDVAELKRKHGLTDKGLESAYRKLAAAGLLTDEELRRSSATENDVPEPSPEEPVSVPWRCPACNAPQPMPVRECPRCGVIVVRFLARQARETGVSTSMQRDNTSVAMPWFLIACCVLVVALVGGMWLLMTLRKAEVKSKRAATDATRPGAQKTARVLESLVGNLLPLEYSPEGFPLGLATSEGRALHLFDTPSPDQGFKRMPPESGAKRYYGEFVIAGRTYLVVAEGTSPPRIYFDGNRNGDLTDDPGPFVGEGPAVVPNHYTFELPYDREEDLTPYRMWMFMSRMGGVRHYSACHWHGLLNIKENARKVVLFDANADGDYSNDPAVIDANNDGKAGIDERLTPGATISVGGTTVKLTAIAPSGRWVMLQYSDTTTPDQ